MAEGNHTVVAEFVFLGLTDNLKLQVLLFTVFLLVCPLTLVGNLGVAVLIQLHSKLHTPRDSFISSLFFLGANASCSTIIIPGTLVTFLADTKIISHTAHPAPLFCSALQ